MYSFLQPTHQPTLAERFNLESADVLVVPKSTFNLVKHMIIYWGQDNQGGQWYLENNPTAGVRWISGHYVDQTYHPIQVRRFAGTPSAKIEALNRATSLLGAAYHLTRFNCEHYANFVQTGASFSRQSVNGVGIVTLGLTAFLISKLF